MKISGWGKFPEIETQVVEFSSLEELKAQLPMLDRAIARGMGRSYGDSSLSLDAVISTRRYNRFVRFDESTGVLCCQSGVTIAEILEIFVPRGWFVKVSPGTKFVSIGGAIASNVHGKNHHKVGAFDCGVISFSLLLADGEIVRCSAQENSDLFYATLGGMGLTGVIGEVELQLESVPSAYAHQRTVRCKNLAETMKVFEDNLETTFSVSWIDCLAKGNELGRSLVFLGEMATPEQVKAAKGNIDPHAINQRLKLAIPFDFPSIALNRYTMSAFNKLYYHLPRKDEAIVDLDSYNYPLDAIHGWNKLYGKSGFFQYQCVLPMENSFDGYQEILAKTADFGLASFLAVLKLFGEDAQYLSFPKRGYTLTMDFPARASTLALADELDGIVARHGGRLYLTKDARMKPEVFDATQRREVDAFLAVKNKFDDKNKFCSVQSERLGITS